MEDSEVYYTATSMDARAASTPVARLEWRDSKYAVCAGDNWIGRGDKCDVKLDHKSLSVHHATLTCDRVSGCSLVDMRSKNSTWVETAPGSNEFGSALAKEERRSVRHGCRIRLGVVECLFVQETGTEDDTSPQCFEGTVRSVYDVDEPFAFARAAVSASVASAEVDILDECSVSDDTEALDTGAEEIGAIGTRGAEAETGGEDTDVDEEAEERVGEGIPNYFQLSDRSAASPAADALADSPFSARSDDLLANDNDDGGNDDGEEDGGTMSVQAEAEAPPLQTSMQELPVEESVQRAEDEAVEKEEVKEKEEEEEEEEEEVGRGGRAAPKARGRRKQVVAQPSAADATPDEPPPQGAAVSAPTTSGRGKRKTAPEPPAGDGKRARAGRKEDPAPADPPGTVDSSGLVDSSGIADSSGVSPTSARAAEESVGEGIPNYFQLSDRSAASPAADGLANGDNGNDNDDDGEEGGTMSMVAEAEAPPLQTHSMQELPGEESVQRAEDEAVEKEEVKEKEEEEEEVEEEVGRGGRAAPKARGRRKQADTQPSAADATPDEPPPQGAAVSAPTTSGRGKRKTAPEPPAGDGKRARAGRKEDPAPADPPGTVDSSGLVESSGIADSSGVSPTSARAAASSSSHPTEAKDPSQVVIIFTGIEKEEALVRQIGAEITEDPSRATHMIIGDELKRTPKLMVAINSGVLFVITLDWLRKSAAKGRALPITKSSKFTVKDAAKEALWDFDLFRTLSQPRGRVFAGMRISASPGLCGVRAPKEEEMRDIVTSGGGEWVAPSPDPQPGCYLVSSAEVAPTLSPAVLEAALRGPGKGVHSLEFVFLAVLRQEVRIGENLVSVDTAGAADEKEPPAAKRKRK